MASAELFMFPWWLSGSDKTFYKNINIHSRDKSSVENEGNLEESGSCLLNSASQSFRGLLSRWSCLYNLGDIVIVELVFTLS